MGLCSPHEGHQTFKSTVQALLSIQVINDEPNTESIPKDAQRAIVDF